MIDFSKMKYFLLLTILVAGMSPLSAAEPSSSLGEAETNWLGVNYQIIFFKRIPPERLLVGVRIVATSKAAPRGTLIGFPVPIPPNADKYAIMAGYYHPLPLSLAASVMIEDLMQQKYPALAPVAPPGRIYRPGVVLDSLRPGQNLVLTVQFAVPPPPPPPPAGQPPAKQTVSFVFPNAKGPIQKIPVPPAAAVSP